MEFRPWFVVVVVFYVPLQYYSTVLQYEKFFLRICSDRLLLLHFDFQKNNASEMPRKRASKAVQHDSMRNQRGRSDKSVQDRESINKRCRERYAQRTLEERENDNARRRKKRAEQPEEGRAQVNEKRRRLRAEQTEEERSQVIEQRRKQYAQESALQTPEEREHTNAQRRELRTELDAEERERVNAQRREHDAQERAEQTPVEQEQNNARHRETYAERRARNLGKTRNNFIREPEAANVMHGSSRVKGLLQATPLSAAPRVKCKFRAYHDRHRHSMTT
jgi:hypothetical protein